MARISPRKITWAGVDSLTLTTSYQASDAHPVDFGKRMTIYPRYTRAALGGANTIQYQLLLNPFDENDSRAATGWYVYGIYTNSTGTWTVQEANYNSTTGTAEVAQNVTPLVLEQIDAAQFKVQIKETVGAGTAGTVTCTVVVNDPVNSH